MASLRPRSKRDRRRADLSWSAPELSCCLHTSSSSTCVLHAAAAGWGAPTAPSSRGKRGSMRAGCKPALGASRRVLRFPDLPRRRVSQEDWPDVSPCRGTCDICAFSSRNTGVGMVKGIVQCTFLKVCFFAACMRLGNMFIACQSATHLRTSLAPA